jgi:hypothetical protein
MPGLIQDLGTAQVRKRYFHLPLLSPARESRLFNLRHLKPETTGSPGDTNQGIAG